MPGEKGSGGSKAELVKAAAERIAVVGRGLESTGSSKTERVAAAGARIAVLGKRQAATHDELTGVLEFPEDDGEETE